MSTIYIPLLQILLSYLGIWILDYLLKFIDNIWFKPKKTYRKLLYTYKTKYKDSKILANKLRVEDKKRRWYLIHGLTNTFIVIAVMSDFLNVVINPLIGVDPNFDTLGLATAIALHLYHIISDSANMTLVDWMHHMISCMLVGLTVMFYLKGKLINCAMFFICGFPGGIDYYLLAFNKYGLISRTTEKRINVGLNMWIRLPGLLFTCFTAYICHLYSAHSYNPLVFAFIIFLNYYNPIYFAIRVVQNYGEHIVRLVYQDKAVIEHEYPSDTESEFDVSANNNMQIKKEHKI